MKHSLVFSLGLLSLSALATVTTNCYPPKVARDAIRAVAIVTDRSMITDVVGSCSDRCQLWANYRNHGYSDHYEVTVESGECRVTSLKLIGARLPIREAD